jgi:hypothetical protein
MGRKPEGFISPMTWGVESDILDRFGRADLPDERISMVKDTFHFRLPDKRPADIIDALRHLNPGDIPARDGLPLISKGLPHSHFNGLALPAATSIADSTSRSTIW